MLSVQSLFMTPARITSPSQWLPLKSRFWYGNDDWVISLFSVTCPAVNHLFRARASSMVVIENGTGNFTDGHSSGFSGTVGKLSGPHVLNSASMSPRALENAAALTPLDLNRIGLSVRIASLVESSQ